MLNLCALLTISKTFTKSLCNIVQLLPNVTCSIAGTAHTAHIATTSNLYNRQNLESNKVSNFRTIPIYAK